MYTFLPANRLRKVLSVNPMDHRPYLSIWRGAYLSTLQRIHLLRHPEASIDELVEIISKARMAGPKLIPVLGTVN